MASEATSIAGLAERYAAALFDLADERKALDATASDLTGLRRMIDESADFRRMIRNPVLQRNEQARAIGAVGERAGLNSLTRNFLGLLARNRRLFALPEMIQRFLQILAERRGEVTAQVIAAQELSATQRQAVNERLRQAVGRKVAVDFQVDPSLLGGLVVKVGSRMVDASLKSKLARLALAMKGAG
ncbi:MAG: F0F1 ATP synthase subunit delta [Alphaproteobacteria bacterium]|nr:F0F1 ATP synthase subunit delta [Alphaproteobacteria bacterium]